jgi:hypothetical protein
VNDLLNIEELELPNTRMRMMLLGIDIRGDKGESYGNNPAICRAIALTSMRKRLLEHNETLESLLGKRLRAWVSIPTSRYIDWATSNHWFEAREKAAWGAFDVLTERVEHLFSSEPEQLRELVDFFVHLPLLLLFPEFKPYRLRKLPVPSHHHYACVLPRRVMLHPAFVHFALVCLRDAVVAYALNLHEDYFLNAGTREERVAALQDRRLAAQLYWKALPNIRQFSTAFTVHEDAMKAFAFLVRNGPECLLGTYEWRDVWGVIPGRSQWEPGVTPQFPRNDDVHCRQFYWDAQISDAIHPKFRDAFREMSIGDSLLETPQPEAPTRKPVTAQTDLGLDDQEYV